VESLGDGWSALFQVEGKVNADVGSGGVNNRETYVGLRGPYGTVRLGLMDSPVDDIKGIFGNVPTGVTSILNTGALWTNGASDYLTSNPRIDNGFTNMNETLPNSIRYDSPTLGPFSAAFQYSHPAVNERPGDPHMTIANVVYSNGRSKAAIALHRNTDVRGAGLNDQTITITGGTALGPVYVAGVYSRQESDTSGTRVQRAFRGASATWTDGPVHVYAFYSTVSNGSLVTPELPDTGAQMYEFSISLDLSKRTMLYAGYVKVDNDANGTYQIGTNRLDGGDIGADSSGLIAGIKHVF
jgi:predicted porin